MALTSFSVNIDDVLNRVPLDTDQISASSRPVNRGDIDTYIHDASSSFVAVLTRAGLDPDNLNDDTLRQVQDAVESYAAAEILDVIGIGGRDMQRFRDKYDNLLDRYSSKPSMLSTQKKRLKSNISTSTTKPSAEFIDTNYQY